MEDINIKFDNYYKIFQNHPDIIFICDVNGNIKESNRHGTNLLSQHSIDQEPSIFQFFQNSEEIKNVIKDNIHKQEIIHFEATLFDHTPCCIICLPLMKQFTLTGIAFILKDITKVKESDQMIQYLTHHDELTGLPNERATIQQLDNIGKTESKLAAIVKFNLVRYRYISDFYGKNYRDELIKTFAKQIRENIPKLHFVGRLSKDEFVAIILNVEDKEQVVSMISQSIEQLDKRACINGKEVYYDFNVGIAFYPDDGKAAHTLVQRSEIAAQSGFEKNEKVGIFNSLNSKQYQRKVMLETELYKAIKKNELYLYYQPVIDTKAGRIDGFEVLLRWKHDTLGLISPAEFIPIAEETGFIIEIGRWSMEQALRQLSKWRKKGNHHLKISLNISVKQFYQQDLIMMIDSLLKKYSIPPECLELEFTESVPMHNIDRFLEIIEDLKKLDIKLSIDDFGTGYSSLSYLTRLKLDKIKIDRSFIQNLLMEKEYDVVVKTIIALARNLRLSIIAEGVELQDQVNFLNQHQCYYMQGFYFSKPLSSQDAEKLLISWNNKGLYSFH